MTYLWLSATLEHLDVNRRTWGCCSHESYISQLLTRRKAPPAPERTDIYEMRILEFPSRGARRWSCSATKH